MKRRLKIRVLAFSVVLPQLLSTFTGLFQNLISLNFSFFRLIRISQEPELNIGMSSPHELI